MLYGSVAGAAPYRLALPAHAHAPDAGGLAGVHALWAAVKDGLALPLLVDAHVAAGLRPPPALTTIPSHLKVLVLAGLDAKSLAAVCCASAELSFVASDGALWRALFEREFGAAALAGDEAVAARAGWKAAFGARWARRARRARDARDHAVLPTHPFHAGPRPPFFAPPPALPFGGMVGGNSDLYGNMPRHPFMPGGQPGPLGPGFPGLADPTFGGGFPGGVPGMAPPGGLHGPGRGRGIAGDRYLPGYGDVHGRGRGRGRGLGPGGAGGFI